MNVGWIVVGIGIFGAFARWIAGSGPRGRRLNLGFVSQQWVAEHRQNSDSQS